MHEYSIVQAIIDRASEEARKRGAVAVKGLSVRIGTLAGVEPELLKIAYDTFRERTLCADAPLSIRKVEALWRCPECGRSFPAGAQLSCPECRVPARLAQGDEIFLDRIEMEVAHV
jgi:hydrogenase nickel incorporation protein HypA/HybF